MIVTVITVIVITKINGKGDATSTATIIVDG